MKKWCLSFLLSLAVMMMIRDEEVVTNTQWLIWIPLVILLQ